MNKYTFINGHGQKVTKYFEDPKERKKHEFKITKAYIQKKLEEEIQKFSLS